MGRQVRYFVDDVDHSALLRFAEVKGFHALPQIVESSIIDSDTFPALQLPTQYVAAAGAVTRRLPKEAYFYLLPKEFAAVEAFYKEMPSSPRLAKLSHTSP